MKDHDRSWYIMIDVQTPPLTVWTIQKVACLEYTYTLCGSSEIGWTNSGALQGHETAVLFTNSCGLMWLMYVLFVWMTGCINSIASAWIQWNGIKHGNLHGHGHVWTCCCHEPVDLRIPNFRKIVVGQPHINIINFLQSLDPRHLGCLGGSHLCGNRVACK